MTKPQSMPLDGVRVIELATRTAGPFCATLLGEFGAEVIKIELPGDGDPLRAMGTMSPAGVTYNFLNDNRNKKDISLDVRKAEGAEIFKQLVAHADIVIENFRPGTLEKWGLGYDVLRAIRREIVLVRISAYGQDGPFSEQPGVARIAYGYAGIAHLTGEPDGPPLLPGSSSMGDYAVGLYAAYGALLAYIHRQKTGEGQVVDATLYESVFRLLDELAPAYAGTGHVRQRTGSGHQYAVPNNHYLTSDKKWIVISCTAQKMFDRMMAVMGRQDLSEAHASPTSRKAARELIDGAVSAWVSQRTREQVLQLCLDGEVTAGPINDIADIFADPHYQARKTLVEFTDARAGKVVIPNVMPRLSATPGSIKSIGADIGQDNQEIFSTLLGLSVEEMRELSKKKII